MCLRRQSAEVTSDATGGGEEAARPSGAIDNGRVLSDVLAYYKDLVTTGPLLVRMV